MDPTGIGTVAEGCDAPPAVVQYGVKGYGPVWGLLPLHHAGCCGLLPLLILRRLP